VKGKGEIENWLLHGELCAAEAVAGQTSDLQKQGLPHAAVSAVH
jgi:hypothetical protein